MKSVVLASANAGKIQEFSSLLAPLGWQVLPQAQLQLPEADEPHATFLENALAKARQAARLSCLPALADDSGICVPHLQHAPGVHSARYAGEPKSDARNNQKLIATLQTQARQPDDWCAYYVCILVWLMHADDPLPVVAEGRWHGRLIPTPQGQGGFGYDAHFWIDELGCTAAQLAPEQKNALSHRGQAAQQLLQRLKTAAL